MQPCRSSISVVIDDACARPRKDVDPVGMDGSIMSIYSDRIEYATKIVGVDHVNIGLPF